jgi:isobutyryl-CoA mutase
VVAVQFLPSEIEELQAYGITRIYHPDDGRSMGLQGMINDLVQKADFPVGEKLNGEISHVERKIGSCDCTHYFCC